MSEPYILVVDDLEINRELVSRVLAPLGLALLHADNGQAVLDQVARSLPRLILMDIAMPVMDGLEATRQLRRIYSKAELPIVMVTAYPRQDYEQVALKAGSNEYISKPIDMKLLLAAARRFAG